jgi:hypothetical protein
MKTEETNDKQQREKDKNEKNDTEENLTSSMECIDERVI